MYTLYTYDLLDVVARFLLNSKVTNNDKQQLYLTTVTASIAKLTWHHVKIKYFFPDHVYCKQFYRL